MNILTWILWGCLLAILVPALLLGFTIILNRVLLGKDPGTRTYDDIMEAQREKREALIEDEDRPSLLDVFGWLGLGRDPGISANPWLDETIVSDLPVDGDKITPQMLDSKSDLKDLIDGSEIFRKKKEMGA